MIIKFTLAGLVILLISVISLSYYMNKEGFEDISQDALKTKYPVMPITPGISDSTTNPSGITVTSDTPLLVSSINSTIPTRTDINPEISVSPSGFDAMSLQQKADLLKDIQKVVRNEILATRLTTPLTKEKEKERDYERDYTASTAQGKEYENSCHKDTEYRCPKNPDGSCPPIPDMSKYIKKDQIPCWGCNLDY